MVVTMRRISGAVLVAARKNPNSRHIAACQARRPMNRQATYTTRPRIATRGMETVKGASPSLRGVGVCAVDQADDRLTGLGLPSGEPHENAAVKGTQRDAGSRARGDQAFVVGA